MKKTKIQPAFLMGFAMAVFGLSLFFTGQARGTQIDFTDEEFEDVAYHELYSMIGPFTETAPNKYCEGKSFYEANFRLVPGRITFYDIAGNPNAYVYVGYFGPGETPTLEGLISKSMETYDERENYISPKKPIVGERTPYREFCLRVFPELLYTNYIILGVNVNEAAFIDARSGVPPIILARKSAEDAAREYFGVEGVEFVRYIWGSKVYGYEYSDGERSVIIPFVFHGSYVDEEHIYTREEVDANVEEFRRRDEAVDDYMKGAYKNFWDRWQKRKETGFLNGEDTYEEEFVEGYGTWCAFKQKWTKRWHNGWCDKNGHDRPIFDHNAGGYITGTPESIFGSCGTIAMASICIYHHFAHKIGFDYNKNQQQGKTERSAYGGSTYFEFPNSPSFSTSNSAGQCPYESDRWTAMFCWVMGGFHTRYDELVPRLENYDSFFIRLPSYGISLDTDALQILKGYNGFPGVLSDFGYNYRVCMIRARLCPDNPSFIISRINANCPFVYNWAGHHVAVYGYREDTTVSPWYISRLYVYDWNNPNWPNETELIGIYYNNAQWHLEMSPPKQVTSEYARNLKVVSKRGAKVFSWEASPSYDDDVLGYNIIARQGGATSRLNEDIIRVEGFKPGRRYKFKSRDNSEGATISLEIVFRKHNTTEYPFEREVKE